MISEEMFDILMEIKKVDKEIAVQKEKLQKNHKKLLILEENINNVKQLQLKSQSILVNAEMKSQVIASELKDLHKPYHELVIYLHEHIGTVLTVDNSLDNTINISVLKKQRDYLKEKVVKARAVKVDVANKLNDIEMQINIETKKNSAMLLRLYKNLEELLQEESRLLNYKK